MSVAPEYKSEFDAFIRGILENPTDWPRRGVFADWLDDHGESDFALTIRAGIELHQIVESEVSVNQVDVDDLTMTARGWWVESETNRFRLYGDPACSNNYLLLHPVSSKLPTEEEKVFSYAVVDRGFLSELYCTKDFFFHCGKEAFARHPITKVRIIDFSMYISHGDESLGGQFAAWFDHDFYSHLIPPHVVVVPWPTRPHKTFAIEGANRDHLDEMVSDYLVDFMRLQIGLPELYADKYPQGRGYFVQLPNHCYPG